ncbi:Levodione reductase [compost metagenome]
MDFTGKVVIVTGAAAGIGRASAIQFARLGAKVVLADVNERGLQETLELIAGQALVVLTNVADEAACQAMVDSAMNAFGRVDVLFSNAGISGARARTADLSPAEWRRVIDINLNGVFYCAHAAIPAMLAGGGGVIINTASVDGLVGMSTLSHYTAAKHGVIGLTKACALEYGKRNIRSVAIAPGFIQTSMTTDNLSESERALFASLTSHVSRAGQPEDVANLVTWLASDQAAYVNGSVHTVDSGLIAGFALPE